MGLFDFFSAQPAKDAAAARVAAQNAGYSQLSDLYGQAGNALTTNTQQGIGLYQPLIQSTGAGSSAYADATGANGPEGLARARALFTATPGYQEGLDQTLNQNDRRAASRGMLNSGNTIADTTKLATDYANQKYGSYVQGLQPYLGANQGAVGGAASMYGQLGTGLAGLYGQQGQAAQATQTGIGNANADAAMADYNASGNLWKTFGGIGQAIASAYTGVPIKSPTGT
jgi:hypothetical protein